MLEGKAVIGETDMLQNRQQDALRLASKVLDSFDVTDCIEIACYIKKVHRLHLDSTKIHHTNYLFSSRKFSIESAEFFPTTKEDGTKSFSRTEQIDCLA